MWGLWEHEGDSWSSVRGCGVSSETSASMAGMPLTHTHAQSLPQKQLLCLQHCAGGDVLAPGTCGLTTARGAGAREPTSPRELLTRASGPPQGPASMATCLPIRAELTPDLSAERDLHHGVGGILPVAPVHVAT